MIANMQMRQNFGNKSFTPKHNMRNSGGDGRDRRLNMKREKYFRLDLDELLTEFKLGDNKPIIAANILNKVTRKSIDAAAEYIDRAKESGKLDEAASVRLKELIQRYSKWR